MSTHLSATSRKKSWRQWPKWFWILCALAPILFIGAMRQVENLQPPDERWHLTSADYVFSHSTTPPPETASWQPITLTDYLRATQGPTSVWLRVTLPPNPGKEHRWLMYLPNPRSTNISLWLDNLRYDGAGTHDSPPLSMPKNPVSLPFSQLALPADKPEIFLRLSRQISGVPVDELYLGPNSQLSKYVSQSVFAKQTLLHAILAMIAVMAVITAIIHLIQQRGTNIYGYWAVAMGVALIYTAHGQLESASFGSLWFWWRTTFVTLGVFVVTNAIFVNRLINAPQHRVERVALAVLVLGSIFILAQPLGETPTIHFVNYFWIFATVLVGVYVVARLWRGAVESAETDVLIMLATTFLGVCVGIRDFLYNDLQLISGSMLYLRHCTGLIVLAFSFVLISRFSRAAYSGGEPPLKGSDFEQPAPGSGELQHRALLEQEHLALEAQLQSAVLRFDSTEETSELGINLRAARYDLQLIRDSIMREDEGNTDIIANMQHRLSQSAERQSTPFIWLTPHNDPLWPTDAHYELAVARFLQTAIIEALEFSDVQAVEAAIESLGEDQQNQVIVARVRARAPGDAAFGRITQYEASAGYINGRFTSQRLDSGELEVRLQWNKPSP